LRKPSVVFALRASRWLFKFAPGEFVLRQRKVSKDQSAGSGLGRHRRTQCERQEGASQKPARLPL
ncbi:MAG: hypothetical protein ACXWFI_14690, partial [Methylobacter sp.]